MLEHTAPRREPRVLLLRRLHGSLVWAAVDPFEVRGVGRIGGTHAVGVRLALARTVLRVHPSAIVVLAVRTHFVHLVLALRGVARRRGLPIIQPTARERLAIRGAAPSAADLAHEFPELATVREQALRRTVALAAASLSIITFPSRRYVPGLPASPASRVGHARAGRARET